MITALYCIIQQKSTEYASTCIILSIIENRSDLTTGDFYDRKLYFHESVIGLLKPDTKMITFLKELTKFLQYLKSTDDLIPIMWSCILAMKFYAFCSLE